MNYKHAILVEAKKRLNKEKFLCYAILRVPHDTWGTYNIDKVIDAVDELCDMISNSLGEYLFVTTWLSRNAGVPEQQLTAKNMLAYRHRWIDSLIEEYK